MTAKLLVREVGQREFAAYNGDYEDDPDLDGPTAAEKAIAEGERLAMEGNVESFQVWVLITARQRVWSLEEVTS